MAFKPYQFLQKKSLCKELGKIWLYANSLELHQLDMHIGYRVIPISVHILSLVRISGFWPTILQHFFCCSLIRWRVSFSFKASSLQPTCYRLWHMQRMRTPWRIVFCCFTLLKLACAMQFVKDIFICTGSTCNDWYFVVIFHLRLCVQMIDPGICTIHRYLAIF